MLTAGDELLRQVALLLQKQVRAADSLARLGGDEFGLLLHQCPLQKAEKIANIIRQSVDAFRFTWQEKTFSVGVSIGLVVVDETSQDLASVLSAAFAACYAAKARGRHCVQVFIG